MNETLLMNMVGIIGDHVSAQLNRIYNKDLTVIRFVFAEMLHVIA